MLSPLLRGAFAALAAASLAVLGTIEPASAAEPAGKPNGPQPN